MSWALACFGVLAAASVAPLPDGQGQIAHIPILCPFFLLTGVPCPGCGMTRALVCLMHGRWAESWSYHPLGLLVAILLAAGGIVNLTKWRGADTAKLLPAQARFLLPYAGTVVFLAVWAVRRMGWDSLPA